MTPIGKTITEAAANNAKGVKVEKIPNEQNATNPRINANTNPITVYLVLTLSGLVGKYPCSTTSLNNPSLSFGKEELWCIKTKMTTLPPRAAGKSAHPVTLRHPEMSHLIERLAADHGLRFLGCFQPSGEMIAEHSFYPEDGCFS